MPEQQTPTEQAPFGAPVGTFFNQELYDRFNEALVKDGKSQPKPDSASSQADTEKPKAEVPATEKPPASKIHEPKPAAEKTDTTLSLPAVLKNDEPKAKVEDDSPPSTIKGTKAAEDWKRMKQQHRERESELLSKIKELESKSSELKETTESFNKDEYEAIKREHELMSDQLRLLDVERHPRFQAYFSQKINNALNLAKQSVGEQMSDKVVQVLQLPEGDYKKEQLRNLFTELDEFQQDDVKEANKQIRSAQFERQQEITKAKENYSKVQQEQQLNEKKVKDGFVSALKNTLKQASDSEKGLPVFQEKEGDEEWNNSVRSRRAAAEQFVNATINGQITPEQLALGATWMMAAEPLLKNSIALANENAQLRSQIEQMKSSVPSAAEGDSTPPAQSQEQSTGNYFTDALTRANRELIGKM